MHLLDLLDSICDLKFEVFVVLQKVDRVHPALQDDVQDRCRFSANGGLQREDFVAQNVLVHVDYTTIFFVAEEDNFLWQAEVLSGLFPYVAERFCRL